MPKVKKIAKSGHTGTQVHSLMINSQTLENDLKVFVRSIPVQPFCSAQIQFIFGVQNVFSLLYLPRQCDQMARLFFDICSFTAMKFSTKACKIYQSSLTILPNAKHSLKIFPKTKKILPKIGEILPNLVAPLPR